MSFQRLKGVHALARDFSPAYQSAGNLVGKVGGGAAVGALSGGISNYAAEGDLDHALRGALTGSMMGAATGGLLRNANPLFGLAATAAVPATLAQVKDRPTVSKMFRPESTDSIRNLYSEERAFTEGSPEWNAYYAANPDRYSARYGQQPAVASEKVSAFQSDVSGPGSAIDLDYYRLHKELREKGYSRQEREEILRNDFGTQLKDMARGAGYGLTGGALGGLAGYGLGKGLGVEDTRLLGNIAALGGAGGLTLGGLLANKDIYDLDQQAIEDAENLGVKQANAKLTALQGLGLLGAGLGVGAGGALLLGDSEEDYQEDFVGRLDEEDEYQRQADMGLISDAEYTAYLIGKKRAGELAMPEHRYAVTTTLDRLKKEASMTLNDIAAMEAMSGTNVGRTQTKVGMIIDSNGVYTLYDDTGKYTYGDFTKLSEAQEHAEKVAKYYATEGGDVMKKRWFRPDKVMQSWSAGGTSGSWQGGGTGYNRFTDTKRRFRFGIGNFDAASQQAQTNARTLGTAQTNAALQQENAALQSQQAKNVNRGDKATQHIKDQARNWKAQAQTAQQELSTARDTAKTTAKELQTATKEREALAKSLKNWKRGAGWTGAALGLGALGYGAYNYFKGTPKEKTFAQHAAQTADDTVKALQPYQKYLPMAQQFINTANQAGQAVGNTAFNPYSAQGGQYQNMPTYGQSYRGGY